MHATRSPIWPFIGIVACLFAMTLLAARTWQRPGREVTPHARGSGGVVVAADRPATSPAVPELQKPSVTSSSATSPVWRNSELSEFAVPPAVQRPAPPVADRIKLDTSLADVPALPTVEPRLRRSGTERRDAGQAETAVPAVETAPGTLARQSVQQAPDFATPWPLPDSLIGLLEPLESDRRAADWSVRLLHQLELLHAASSLSDPSAARALHELQRLVNEGVTLAGQQSDISRQAALLRVVYALERRMAIWQSVCQLAFPAVQQVSLRDFDARELTRKLQAVELQLQQLENSAAWRKYLLLDQLSEIAGRRWVSNAQERSSIAREFLRRVEAADETPEQEAFFARPPWQDFALEMRQWVCEPVDYEALLDDLERLEASGTESAARAFAGHYQVLRWSSLPAAQELGNRINIYYRNANVRVAISGELLNRLLPHPQVMEEDVDDMLLGGRVFGRSQVSTRLKLILLPDRERWQLGLEASGHVDSQTETKRGPARFHNAGRSRYLARKLLLIDRRGIRSEDAEAAASAKADLTAMETDLDGVPLVNLLVRAIARQQYDSQVDTARFHAEGLVADRAGSRLDEEVDQKLSEATQSFRAKFWLPLHALGLRPEAVDMQTTEDRLIARYRLASYEQAAAFTPRPQAPSESLLSIQVHESMLNNTVACLDLGGRELPLRQLFSEVATKLQLKRYQVPEEVPEDVTIELAARDAIAFRCSDDRLYLTLRLKKLAAGSERVWRDFEVCGIYAPTVDGLRAGVQRDSYIRLKGRRLSTGDQVALRGIFAKVLAQQPDIDLLGNILVRDNRLHDLRVTQFVIRDGWVGLAVGTGEPVKFHLADEPDDVQSR